MLFRCASRVAFPGVVIGISGVRVRGVGVSGWVVGWALGLGV